jgi:hypothetical protein
VFEEVAMGLVLKGSSSDCELRSGASLMVQGVGAVDWQLVSVEEQLAGREAGAEGKREGVERSVDGMRGQTMGWRVGGDSVERRRERDGSSY